LWANVSGRLFVDAILVAIEFCPPNESPVEKGFDDADGVDVEEKGFA
jgi:hypothetical protein